MAQYNTVQERGSSDHNFISVTIRTKNKLSQGQESYRRVWKNFDPVRFRARISNIDWSPLYESRNIDVINDFFVNKVSEALNAEAPFKFIQNRRNHCNWLTDEIQAQMRDRDRRRQIARDTDDFEDWINYRKARNDCSKALIRRKNEYFKNIFEALSLENDAKNIYRTAKNLMGWSAPKQPKMFLINGTLYRKPLEMANILLDFYNSKIESLGRALEKRGRDPLRFLDRALAQWEGTGGIKTFTIRQISRSETLELIRKLGNSTAHGRDGIDALTIKTAAADLSGPLTHLINTSIRSQTFASRWKLSRIIPHLKSQDSNKLEPGSYRPVALLPTVSKLIERTVQQQLQKHLEKEKLLNQNNHAYRTCYSTTTAIIQLTERLYTATDSNLISQLLAIDQTSAFDCVNHDTLVKKLGRYGCSVETINWMKSYLGDRSQYINLGRHNSRITAIKSGVPQGSILGPLLFLVYTNEITETVTNPDCRNSVHRNHRKLFGENCVECGTIISYADDTTYHVGNKVRIMNQIKINRILTELEDFLTDNDLTINMGKTLLKECMIKQKKGRTGGNPPSIDITTPQGEPKVITDSENFRVLGINIQQNMGWSSHLETGKKAVFPKIRKQFGALKMIGKKLPRTCKKLLVEGLLISKMQYMISVWANTDGKYNRTAQRLENQMARWVTGCGRFTRISSLMGEVGWWTIQEMSQIQSLTYLWKFIHIEKPEVLREMITIEDDLHLTSRTPRLKFTESSFLIRAIKTWNRLPPVTRELGNITTFKKHIKKWIKDNRDREPDL